MIFTIKNSKKKGKRYDLYENDKYLTSFGSSEHENYTTHKDPERKKMYINRHQKKEDWSKNGLKTAGFWSKHLIWNLPTLEDSAKDIEKKFGIKVILQV